MNRFVIAATAALGLAFAACRIDHRPPPAGVRSGHALVLGVHERSPWGTQLKRITILGVDGETLPTDLDGNAPSVIDLTPGKHHLKLAYQQSVFDAPEVEGELDLVMDVRAGRIYQIELVEEPGGRIGTYVFERDEDPRPVPRVVPAGTRTVTD